MLQFADDAAQRGQRHTGHPEPPGAVRRVTAQAEPAYRDDLSDIAGLRVRSSAGEMVALIGPSGSGKSTLCRTINRLETISSGEITVDGTPLPEEGRALARLRADVGMVFQSFNLFAHRTVLQNVTLGPVKAKGMRRAEARELAAAENTEAGTAFLAENGAREEVTVTETGLQYEVLRAGEGPTPTAGVIAPSA